MSHCFLVNQSVFFIPREDKALPSVQILFTELRSHLPFCPARDDRPRFFVFILLVCVCAYHDQHFVIWKKKKKTRKHHVQCVKALFSVLIHRKGGEAAPWLVLHSVPLLWRGVTMDTHVNWAISRCRLTKNGLNNSSIDLLAPTICWSMAMSSCYQPSIDQRFNSFFIDQYSVLPQMSLFAWLRSQGITHYISDRTFGKAATETTATRPEYWKEKT